MSKPETIIQVIPVIICGGSGTRLWPLSRTGFPKQFLCLTGSRSFRVVMTMLAFGAGIEAAQWAVGWRFAEWTDFAADALGVLGAWGLWKIVHFRGSN